MNLSGLLKGHQVAYKHSQTGQVISASVVDIIRNDWVIVRKPNLELPIPVPAERVLYRIFASAAK